jgi:cytochrome c oxidase subunit IV
MKAHAVPAKVYVRIWAALLALLLLTWGLAQINLGSFNVVVALGIAMTKMFLVILFFMHVRHSSRLTWLFVAAGFIWLAIMVDLTLSDYLSRRGWQRPKPAEQTVQRPAAGFAGQSRPSDGQARSRKHPSEFHLH